MDITERIEKYIVYLIGECGLSVTLHPMEPEALITFSSLMRFNTHDNSYCTVVKSRSCGYEKCIKQQRRVFEKIKTCREPFFGICPSGVGEYVYPLTAESGVIGFISVSGYRTDEGKERVPTASASLGLSEPLLARAYASLKPTVDERERVDTLVYPLCSMLELAYRKEDTREDKESLITRIMRYIRKNYSTDLRVDDVCRLFGCSRSYFTHSFRREAGKSFREYLTDIRLENAKRLLTLSHLNMTEIAYSVGFSDSNYFTGIFKKRNGRPPLVYRKMTRKK